MTRRHGPQIVGIVNITEDSFSDGGRYLAAEDAVAHACELRSAGADIVELGPAASHPDSMRVSADQEWLRLAPVIEHLTARQIPVSVDSYLPETQRYAIACGAAYLNDIQGSPETQSYAALADADCRLVVMHSVQRTGPATKVATDPAAILPFSFSPELELITDPSLLADEEIFFNAARLDRSLALNAADYAAIAQPRLESITANGVAT
jgi:dihydropteroate synthase